MKNLYRFFLIFAIILIVGASATLHAVPSTIDYQGILSGSDDQPLDTTVSIQFAIYSDSTNGSPLWSETHTSVAVVSGLFSVQLGSINPFAPDLFANPPLYLGITVGSDTEIVPRTRLSSGPYSQVAGSVEGFSPGQHNVLGGSHILVSGDSNTVLSDYSTVAGGKHNTVEVMNFSDTTEVDTTDIFNSSPEFGSTIDASSMPSQLNVSAWLGGGGYNTASGFWSVVVGGGYNTSWCAYSAVVGGYNNITSGSFGFIGAGARNRIGIMPSCGCGQYSVITGGYQNFTQGRFSTIGGGLYNYISNCEVAPTISGGYKNSAIGHVSTIGGGYGNSVNGFGGTVSGGQFNSSGAQYASVGGGQGNSISADHSTISGGLNNQITGQFASIGGGTANKIDGYGTTIAGGDDNNAQLGTHQFIGGGLSNIASYDFATIGGGLNNQAWTWATVGGGQGNLSQNEYTFIGGGLQNLTNAHAAVVSGGLANKGGNWASSVGGGQLNEANGYVSRVGGGNHNLAQADSSTIGGGSNNVAVSVGGVIGGGTQNRVGPGDNATVPGGSGNGAVGQNSFAAGTQATAADDCSFVWADCCTDAAGIPGGAFLSYGANTFNVRATGGVYLVTSCDTTGGVIYGAVLPPGAGAWATLSDKNSKNIFGEVDGKAILEQLDRLPILRWSYKAQDDSILHIGPTAQDFYGLFGLGDNDKSISTIDPSGIALAAIKELHQKTLELEQKTGQIEALQSELQATQARVDELAGMVTTLMAERDGSKAGETVGDNQTNPQMQDKKLADNK